MLKEQIDTMKRMATEQDDSIIKSLIPRVEQAMAVLQEEIRKENKETSKLRYQVDELVEDSRQMSELTQSFFDRMKYLYDFIGA